MKKRLIALLSILSLFLSSPLIPANAAAKAGAKCTKAGITSVASGKTYTCIKSGKKLVWDKGSKSQSTSSSTNTSTPTFLNSPYPLDTCRVTDSRTTKNISGAIAYPVNSAKYPPAFPVTGTLNVAVIPIDFPDVPGNGTPSTLIGPEMDQTKKWVEHFSNGKLHYNIQMANKWIRAGRDSSYFNWVHPGSLGNPLPNANSKNSRSATEITTELMKYAENDFDYKNLNIVFFVYPKEVVDIWDAMTTFGSVSTNVGTVRVQMNATGAWLYRNSFPIWPWFIHENMHPQGLAGHAPFDGSPFNIMTNQGGASFVLDAWDQVILDWQKDNEIYCTTAEDLAITDVPMNSIDNNDLTGTKSIFIKLSNHEVLVVESRKKAYWSQGWLSYKGLNDDFKGLLVYKVDTSVDLNRVENNGFANYILNNSANNGNYQGPYAPNFNLNCLVEPGQTLTTSGVKITLVNSGSYDLVRIAKSI